MGAVWLARLRRLRQFDKLVAIKTVLPQHAADLRLRRMFLDEARVAFAVAHPNVGAILDAGDQDGTLYLVMEWIEGESLRALDRAMRAKGERIPPGVALRVIADACAGLHAVHEARGADGVLLEIVHRDVSPQNVLVDVTGHAKLIDFGIARSRDRIAGDTSTGGLKGKMRYMAPEQAFGKTVDRRSDIWSTGAVLYSILEGRVPFDGDSDVAILRAILEGRPIPWPSAAVPPPVAEVVMRSLRVEPADRYATAVDMKRALENAMRAAAIEATTTEVAAFLASAVGTELAARKALVSATSCGLGEEPDAASGRASVPTVPAASRASADIVAKPLDDARTFAPTSQPPTRLVAAATARTGRRVAYGGAGAAVVVLAAVLLVHRFGTARVQETPPTPEPAQAPANASTAITTATGPQPAEPVAQALPALSTTADAAAPPHSSVVRTVRSPAKSPLGSHPRDPLDNRK
jgi:serine/threonine-protein kinase